MREDWIYVYSNACSCTDFCTDTLEYTNNDNCGDILTSQYDLLQNALTLHNRALNVLDILGDERKEIIKELCEKTRLLIKDRENLLLKKLKIKND